MWYTIIWLILWLMMGNSTLSMGTPAFLALVVAILADIFINGVWLRTWQRRV